MNVGDLINRQPVCCRLDAPIENVADQMRRAHVGAVIVVDEHNCLAGIVTDRDVLIRGAMEGLSAQTPVDKVMTSDVEFAYATDDVFDAATRMATRGCRRLPVLDPSGSVTGMISLDDLLVLFAIQIEKLARTVGHEMRPEPEEAPIQLRDHGAG